MQHTHVHVHVHNIHNVHVHNIHVHVHVLWLLDCLSGLGGWESFPFHFHCLLAGVLCTCTSMYSTRQKKVPKHGPFREKGEKTVISFRATVRSVSKFLLSHPFCAGICEGATVFSGLRLALATWSYPAASSWTKKRSNAC